MKKILCWFGFHDDDFEDIIIEKRKSFQTGNCRFVCKVCGRATEWSGYTHFGPIKIKIKE